MKVLIVNQLHESTLRVLLSPDDSAHFSYTTFYVLPFSCFVCHPQNFYHNGRAKDNTKKPPRSKIPSRAHKNPEALQLKETGRLSQQLQLRPSLCRSPDGKQPEPLPAIGRCQELIALEEDPKLRQKYIF